MRGRASRSGLWDIGILHEPLDVTRGLGRVSSMFGPNQLDSSIRMQEGVSVLLFSCAAKTNSRATACTPLEINQCASRKLLWCTRTWSRFPCFVKNNGSSLPVLLCQLKLLLFECLPVFCQFRLLLLEWLPVLCCQFKLLSLCVCQSGFASLNFFYSCVSGFLLNLIVPCWFKVMCSFCRYGFLLFLCFRLPPVFE